MAAGTFVQTIETWQGLKSLSGGNRLAERVYLDLTTAEFCGTFEEIWLWCYLASLPERVAEARK